MFRKVQKTDEEWKNALVPEVYRVMFQGGTEAPFSGKYNDFKGKGTYLCAACGAPLFNSEAKYEHGTGEHHGSGQAVAKAEESLRLRAQARVPP